MEFVILLWFFRDVDYCYILLVFKNYLRCLLECFRDVFEMFIRIFYGCVLLFFLFLLVIECYFLSYWLECWWMIEKDNYRCVIFYIICFRRIIIKFLLWRWWRWFDFVLRMDFLVYVRIILIWIFEGRMKRGV